MRSKALDGLEDETVVSPTKQRDVLASGTLQAVVISAALLDVHDLPETGTVTIGRYRASGIAIDDESISRFHAVLHLGAKYQIEDCGSANGTAIEGMRVPPNTLTTFHLGSVIKLGAVVLVVQRRPRR